jgi:tripartite-type tricarboxylate transporter receptor subunit TctC
MPRAAPMRRAVIAGALAAPMLARAAGWPTRPIRLIVPWAPGGGVDLTARRVAPQLAEALGQPVMVENRTGGAGTIGAGEVARAAPDGATLLQLDNSFTMLPHVAARLPFDPLTAFVPIILCASAPAMLAIRASLPFRSLDAFIAAAKAAPGAYSFGSGGVGSSPHFAGEAFMQAAGIRLLHVPFRGGAEATMAVASGAVDMVVATVSTALGQVQAARLLPLAMSGERRDPQLPEVPTFAEAGLPGYAAGIWSGLAAPAGTPPAILDRIETETRRALEAAALRQGLATLGLVPEGRGQVAFAALLQEETARWGVVAAKAGIEKQ